MQLGTRWSLGAEPPTGLPEVVVIALQAVEGDLEALPDDTSAWRWTLTWLEGNPVIELDDGTVIRFDPKEDSATITQPAIVMDDDEDWI
ncbi:MULTISPECIES: hypothetical protein [Cryobacterium]|uniref:Fe-S oxidoreductase n=1 Tax=Cryobacterium zongtaii TaxID=1259217 RepID=A0A2S3ZIX6_9MICO|nr:MULTISPECIES: hypothetical protein [Cryobacterium]ASD22328.1 hypothetical protein B7495_09705 [Cryobacterium sp. LW097]POH65630.1 hypothetical protein C3B60_12160 [Cryobacterium zongtaii]POH67546.1 hypothetical protein C3B61_06470 [Cryobacterium zongtaii]TFC45330.1 hypothetical protein E3O57_09495 [Cryobacterium sp. TMN-39-2]TFC55514.1 hypothetical protein E3O68_05675 [Cryobacterium sp. TMB3-1-2]